MALKFLIPSALSGSNADDTYLKTVLRYGDTTQYTAQIKALQDYGIHATFYQNGTRTQLLNELNQGYPVAVGILHHGHVSSPRGGGHWMLLIGDDGTHGVFHDPYGELDNVNGGYVRIGSGGKGVKYSWKNWLKRWEVEGPRTGWFMTFRPVKPTLQPPVTPSFENSWDGVKAAAKHCGAKWPEVVAAQWALESGWGKHTSGKNNFFGIKGKPGTTKETKEFINGKWITILDTFKDYPTPEACIDHLVTLWYKDYKGYEGVNRALNAEQCCHLLRQEGYATDPKYPEKLIKLIKENNQ